MIQVYTGNGKGKTTAALGLSMRAVGQGLRVCFVQFMKPTDFETGEKNAAASLSPALKLFQFGDASIWGKGRPKETLTNEMKEAVRAAFRFVKETIIEGHYDIIVLDEISVALNQGLIDLNEFLELLEQKPDEIELVLTGRGTPKEIIDRADLVTEMVKVKHPYDQGAKARKGIEY